MDLPALPPLRPEYQTRDYALLQDAARRLQQERGRGVGFGILAVAPTGYGKTLLALHLWLGALIKAMAAAREVRVLWLAGRSELVTQPRDRLASYGWNDVRVIQAGEDEGNPGAPITLASTQTLLARDMRPPGDIVILDECRHFAPAAQQWNSLASAYPRAIRIGLDATPARSDGSGQGDLFDALVALSSVAELTALGYLVPATIYAPDAYQSALSDTPLAAYQRLCPGRRCLVFCASRAQAERDAAEFREAGIPAEAVDANTPAAVRRAALDRVRSGETLVLCNVLLFTEGLDLVELEAIIIARGVSHESTWIQIGGRGLRTAEHIGKTRCIIIDLRGHVHRYGLLDEPRTYSLEGKPIRRLEALPCVRCCPSCLAWGRGGQPCGACGTAIPPPPPPKLTKRQLKEIQRQREPRAGKEWDLWQSLVREQRQRGHKPQAAALRFKARTGHWPRWGMDQVEEGTCQQGSI